MSALLAAVLVAVASSSPAPAPSPDFARDSTWDTGKAEVITYSTTSSQRAPYESRLAIRKGLTAKKNVASLEMIYDSDAGNRHESAVSRFERATFRPIEIEAAWSDSSGRRTVHVRVQESELAARSEGDAVLRVPSVDPHPLFYDVLPSMLRAYDLSTPSTFSVLLLPTQLSREIPSATLIPAEVVFHGHAGRPSETSRGGLQVDVRHQGKTDRMWFHPGPGHELLVWERADGTTLTYKKSERRIYEEKPD